METFTAFIFDQPSFLLVIAFIFLLLGGSIVYFLMKQRSDYVKNLKDQNKQLWSEKNKWMEKALDWKDVLDKQEKDKDA